MNKEQQRRFQLFLESFEDVLNTEPTTDAGRLACIEFIMEMAGDAPWRQFPSEMKLRAIQKARDLMEILVAKQDDQYRERYKDLLDDLRKKSDAAAKSITG